MPKPVSVLLLASMLLSGLADTSMSCDVSDESLQQPSESDMASVPSLLQTGTDRAAPTARKDIIRGGQPAQRAMPREHDMGAQGPAGAGPILGGFSPEPEPEIEIV
eukprot:CAMPEP_0170626892 /NCGR_PEP_ID=MMETSP0224-20130122/31625_1 /TAXON_ID=285029 /ORGANISM="Togula jolla, Strain CCCM 725" /LENGTH=105 /DNA_ID=CAMNT_0010953745 /DNA_START=81 /DNA_END=398 /DNA_ORIENTATION=-